MMIEDKIYCMSSFLMFRTIVDDERCFDKSMTPVKAAVREDRDQVHDSAELYEALKRQVEEMTAGGRTAVALSGGIDSAIMAKFMPKGSTAYTFQCIVPGIPVTDETPVAAGYAKECGLHHKIIEMYWEDFERYAPILMRHKGAPIHSIEVQIYKAALRAKADGFDRLLFGEGADVLYGGLSGLLSRDWTFGEFVDRYSYVMPYHVLKDPRMILDPYMEYLGTNGYVDVHGFNSHILYREALGSYLNACECAGIEFCAPFSNTILDTELDLRRIRAGENKYLVREVFKQLYPGFEIPEKTPMPRPMNEWFKDWDGPHRPEFLPNCTVSMTGDQRWLVWCLEQFLNMLDGKELH